MGVRRILVSESLIAFWLMHGTAATALVGPIRDAQVLDARFLASPNRRCLELLIESPHLDGLGSEGLWPAIAEGRWDEFPVLNPTLRVLGLPPGPPDRLEIEPGVPLHDPDDKHGEVAGA